MTSEKNFVPLIKQALTNIIGTIEFKKTNSTALLSLRILSSAILALCRDAFSLLENNRIFTACSLVCQATEAQIQLLCIDKLYDTKGRDYYEFAFIEQLKSLPINPHWQEKTLQRMHYYNCERFYNGKGKNTADFNSYNKNWYNSFKYLAVKLPAFTSSKNVFSSDIVFNESIQRIISWIAQFIKSRKLILIIDFGYIKNFDIYETICYSTISLY